MVPNHVLYQTELLPVFFKKSAPERSRTPNLLIRSQALYPIELRAHDAEGRARTGTVATYRRILSPVRLPIPPPRQDILVLWSGRRDSNPRPPPWQGDILPLNYFRKIFYLMVRVKGVEPPCPKTLDPKSSASANSATPACLVSHGGFEPPTLWLKARCSTD